MAKAQKSHNEDITFCMSKCNKKSCFRHKSNIKLHWMPHSFAYLKDTVYCPEHSGKN